MADSDSEEFASADEDVQIVHKSQENIIATKLANDFSEGCDLTTTEPCTRNKGDNSEGKITDCENVNVRESKQKSRPGVQRKQRSRETSGKPKKLGTKIGTPVNNPNRNILSGCIGHGDNVELNTVPDRVPDADSYPESESKKEKEQIKIIKTESKMETNEKIDLHSEAIPNENEFESLIDKLSEKVSNKDTSWSSWGNWGITSIISTATSSVSTLTSHVSEGLNTVLVTGVDTEEEAEKFPQSDTIEELPKETEVIGDSKKMPETGLFDLGNLMSGVSSITKMVEEGGSKVITGGLDTLEIIGKKTMEVVTQERSNRRQSSALSETLQEPSGKADNNESEEGLKLKKPNFESLFDDYQGLVHLEALEMLSKQCEIKIQTVMLSLSGSTLTDFQEKLQKIQDKSVLPDPDDEEILEENEEKLLEHLTTAADVFKEVGTVNNIMKIKDDADNFIKDFLEGNKDLNEKLFHEIFVKAVSTLAEITARSMEVFHKSAELLLVKDNSESQFYDIENYILFTTTLSSEVNNIASKFAVCLNTLSKSNPDVSSVNSLVTDIFYEATNSSTYIQDAFQLLIPILQYGFSKE